MNADAVSLSRTLDSHGRALRCAHPPLRCGRACRGQSRDFWLNDGMWSPVSSTSAKVLFTEETAVDYSMCLTNRVIKRKVTPATCPRSIMCVLGHSCLQ